FFRYLELNSNAIRQSIEGVSITLIKALVGRAITKATLAVGDGTGQAVPTVDNTKHTASVIESVSLDAIAATHLRHHRVRLLKSDVDGYDFDVINSAEKTLTKDRPILYFECQYQDENQRQCYVTTLTKLTELGYKRFWVFDNFGGLILQTDSLDVLRQLIDYVWWQNVEKSTRTIYYYDFLACTSTDVHGIEKVVAQYVTQI